MTPVCEAFAIGATVLSFEETPLVPFTMGFSPSALYAAPAVNPINKKAHSVPLLNPINVYGRVFFFSWFGFMIAFWSW